MSLSLNDVADGARAEHARMLPVLLDFPQTWFPFSWISQKHGSRSPGFLRNMLPVLTNPGEREPKR